MLTSEGCHLCEEAELMLKQVFGADYEVEKIEIAFDDALMEKWADKIPVLTNEKGAELLWPFSALDLLAFKSGD